MPTSLPIHDVLDEIDRALDAHGCLVLQAPPGAGKSTGVPLHFIQTKRYQGRILMLEPRRLATRATAERIADLLGETVGSKVGYRMRGETNSSASAKLEVVTEGILTRMIQSDPELSGVDCVIFDEFHERSLHADLGLALCLEVRSALREDLNVIVMSATLDAGPVADLIGNAPVVTALGRNFPVEDIFLPRPWSKPNQRGPRLEDATSSLIETALSESEGSLLAFLPGAGEIHRVEELLKNRLGPEISIHPLYGALPFAQQRAAIAPVKTGRKVVLATSIAETSLTIDGIGIVVDAGRSRRARFDATSGLSRLITERVTKAEATQRAGRAGRLFAGKAYKLWTKGENGGMIGFPLPEILSGDITELVLELAQWGVTTPDALSFLTPPRATDFASAQAVLVLLGALDSSGKITKHGEQVSRLPLPARLASMVLQTGEDGPLLASLLNERDVMNDADTVDLRLRWEALHAGRLPDKNIAKRLRHDAKRIKAGKNERPLADMVALAYPDRIAMARSKGAGKYLLSNGRGAVLNDKDMLAKETFLVVNDLTDATGLSSDAQIRQALPISRQTLEALFKDKLIEQNICQWSKRDSEVLASQQICLGPLVLSEKRWLDCTPDAIDKAMIEGIRTIGVSALPWTKAARYLVARIDFIADDTGQFPDVSDDGLLDSADDWLLPFLEGKRTLNSLKTLDLVNLIKGQLNWEQQQELDRLAPASIKAPTGTSLPVDYSGEQPSVSVRLQEMFGLNVHPTVGPNRLPLRIDLLSPAQKTVQSTSDLPNFWKTSYIDVRKDMRGRYPRHPWPEDPSIAEPTRRVKPRGT
jgi:ATP-dependent helicase HrpB